MDNNPFYRRGPIREIQHFYNRHSSVKRTLGLLRELQHIAVVGSRRIGKTSFLHYISHPPVLRDHGIDHEKTIFVYVDCQGLSPLTREEIYRELLTSINDALSVVGTDANTVSPLRDEQMSYTLFLRTLREISREGFEVILLLDEFEAMSYNPNLGEAFFDGLRALPDKKKRKLVYVTASCISLDELYRKHDSSLISSFFNTFYPIQLGLFSREDSRHLIEESLRKAEKHFSPQVLDLVLETGGNHPFFLQIAGYWAFGPPPVSEKPTDAERKAFLKNVNSEAVTHFRIHWRKLGNREQYVLAALPLLGKDISFQESLECLKNEHLIVQRKDRYDYFSPLLETFVRRQKVSGLLQTGPLLIDRRREQVLLRGVPLSLSATNYVLLVHLVERAGQVVSKEALWQAVWPGEHYVSDERLKSSIKNLRRALGDAANCIANRPGVGYIYQASPEP
jgi:hypothetical protein